MAADAPSHIEADFLIIGAGVAGLLLASQLIQMKRRTVVLESGGKDQVTETHPLNQVVQLGDDYSGATIGRFRCLGGTSTRWGGALIPFSAHDLASRPYLDLPAFPVEPQAIEPYLPQVEKLFHVDAGSYEEDFVKESRAAGHVPIGDPDFKARFAKWPPFKNRNVATLLRDIVQGDRLEVWINATATDFLLDRASGRIKSVTARDAGGRSLTVQAKCVVICAGAIETTRLLLLLDRAYEGRIFCDSSALGRFFYDHLSVPMAAILAKRARRLNRLAGFRFVGTTMRSLRFELSETVQERERVASAFGHISFRTDRVTGFDNLRELLRSRQRSGRFQPSLIMATLRDAPFVTRAALWRLAYNQLLWPQPASYELHVVAEQKPRWENHIELSSLRNDLFGLPLAAISWKIYEEDRRTFAIFRKHFGQFWERQKLNSVGDIVWFRGNDTRPSDQPTSTDVYHPGGSTKMGIDNRSAVVDPNLRSFQVPNLWIASTSTFPSGGGANPTLTLMLFTMRLANHLRATWSS